MLALLVTTTALVLQPAHHVRTRGAYMMTVAEMPEQLADWGCDAKLWEGMPPGARRDLGRFVRDGKEDVARKRITTMREIAEFTAACEPGTTDEEARGLWEAAEAAKEVARVKAEKAAKTAAAKAKREAEKAAEEAKAAAEAKAAEAAAAKKAAEAAAAKAAEEAAAAAAKAAEEEAARKEREQLTAPTGYEWGETY